MKKLIITLFGSLAVIVTCAILFFVFRSPVEEKKFSTSVNDGVSKHVPAAGRESKSAGEKKSQKPSVKTSPPAAVETNASGKKNIYEKLEVTDEEMEAFNEEMEAAYGEIKLTDEEIEAINEEIEAMEDTYAWDSDKTAQILKNVLLGTPPLIRKRAYETVTNSLDSSLKDKGKNMVDLEMVYTAMEETVPPKMPWMKEMIKNYIENLEEE